MNTSLHKTILFQILKDIYSEPSIAPFLGFKGGTAALIFYGLSRFSVDLDFDLLDAAKEDLVFEKVIEIVKKYGVVKETCKKRFNLLCVLSYEEKAHNIKIEINRRSFGSKYELKTHLGTSMLVMKIEDMVAHKLMAMHERIGRTSRDIYDVWFFLSKMYPINDEIVESRSGKTFRVFIEECIAQLEKLRPNHILDGMGELLTESQKDWARAELKDRTIFALKILISID